MRSTQERLRCWAKSVPFANQLRRTWERTSARRYQRLLTGLAAFVPYSAGSPRMLSDQALVAAEQTIPALASLTRAMKLPQIPVVNATDFCASADQRHAAAQLRAVFEQHGSDKSNFHNYELVYGVVLRDPHRVRSLLEVGLGSGDRNIVSNMGRSARPGASLRAFRDYLPNADIFGADIDRRVLFEEERIYTFHVDQTDPASVGHLRSLLPGSIDVVIDDGLHAPNANLSTLRLAADVVRPGGWVIIEDISERALPVWEVVTALITSEFRCQMVRARNGLVFVAQRQ